MDSFVSADLILINVLDKKVNTVTDDRTPNGKKQTNQRRGFRSGGADRAKKVFDFDEKMMLCMPRYKAKMSSVKVMQSMGRLDMSGFWNKVGVMDSIISEEEVSVLATQMSKQVLFKYGRNAETQRMVFDCNYSDALNILIERRLAENCTDYDMLNNCSSIFLRWYYYTCLDLVPEFSELKVENDDQLKVIVMAQMSQLALCIASDYVNLKCEKLTGIYFSIEVLFLVALGTRLYESDVLDVDSMMNAVSCVDFSFIKNLFDIKQSVNKFPTWLTFSIMHNEEDEPVGNELKIVSQRLDDDYTLYVNNKFKPVIKLKDLMIYNSAINRSILNSDFEEMTAQVNALLSTIDQTQLHFSKCTLKRVKAVCKRVRLKEFKMIELILDDMFNSYDDLTATTE